jgi:2-oxoisovalerate dehydrogenase E1 component alpha subunit
MGNTQMTHRASGDSGSHGTGHIHGEPDAWTVQLMDIDGTALPSTTYDASLIDHLVPSMYEAMVVTREVDAEMVNLQRQGQLALYAPCRGQEAAQVASTFAVTDDDWLFPQYRELGVYLARGIAPADVGSFWRGAWHGVGGFTERRIAPISIPIGSHSLHAVGAAMASTRLGDGTISVAFLGDGATSTGDVHEAFNLAAVEQAPCVFFVQNNGWAISLPTSSQMRGASIADRGAGYEIPAVRVDGNDVVAVWLVMQEAAQRARSGGGPTIIEAVTYRMGPHTTADDPRRYRDEAEVHRWAQRDPIDRCRRYLHHRGWWSNDIEAQAQHRATEAKAALRAGVVDAPDPSPLELFDHVYCQLTTELVAQRLQLASELERWGS